MVVGGAVAVGIGYCAPLPNKSMTLEVDGVGCAALSISRGFEGAETVGYVVAGAPPPPIKSNANPPLG